MYVNIRVMTIRQPRFQCCASLLSDSFDAKTAQDLATLFRVLGDASRLQILNLIAKQPEQEVCACQLTESLELSQPTISHHLKVMYQAGLLAKERRGVWIYYRILPEQLKALRLALS